MIKVNHSNLSKKYETLEKTNAIQVITIDELNKKIHTLELEAKARKSESAGKDHDTTKVEQNHQMSSLASRLSIIEEKTKKWDLEMKKVEQFNKKCEDNTGNVSKLTKTVEIQQKLQPQNF